MASGAPRPGGPSAVPPGGLSAVRAGGTNLNDPAQNAMRAGYPDFDISPAGDLSGARVEQTRSVANLRKGRAQGSVSYNWTLTTKPGGSSATVSGGSTATASFTPDAAGVYELRCQVTFSDSTVVTKSVRYTSA